MRRHPDETFVTIGWWGYFLSASVFVFGALKTGDLIGLTASTFFLIATIFFLIPHYRKQKNGGKDG